MNKQDIIDYCLSLPGVYEESSKDGVFAKFRYSTNKKCFVHVYERNGHLFVNIKSHPDTVDFLRQTYKDINVGFNTDKSSWNAIRIGGDVPEDELRSMISESYNSVKPKRSATWTTLA